MFSALSHSTHSLQSLLAIPFLDRYNNVFFGGILGSLFSLLQFLSSPLFGSLSDVHGRKPLFALSLLGSLLSYAVLFSFCQPTKFQIFKFQLWSISANSFSLFFLSRIIGGLSKASVSLAIAVVTDIMPDEQRGKGMVRPG